MPAKYISVARELSLELRLMCRSGVNRLPGEKALCEKYSCSRQTVRSALAELEKRGLILRKQGSGTYISELFTARIDRVAILVPDRGEYIYPSIIRDIRRFFSDKGYTLDCFSTNGNTGSEREILLSLLENPPAGIIMEAINSALPCRNQDLMTQFEQQNIPVVFLHNAYELLSGAVLAGQDNFGGAYSLVEYLAAKGHRSIAAIMPCHDIRGIERYNGFMQACLDLELEYDDRSCFWFTSDMRDRLVNGSNRVLTPFIRDYLPSRTAVVCFNDEIAFPLMRLLSTSDVQPTRKPAVVSFDNSHYCHAGPVGITSMRHESHAVGNTAAKMLFSMIGGKKCSSVRVPWVLTERDSG